MNTKSTMFETNLVNEDKMSKSVRNQLFRIDNLTEICFLNCAVYVWK